MNLGTRWCGGQGHAPAVLLGERESVPIAQEAVWFPGLVWTGVENISPPGFFFTVKYFIDLPLYTSI